MPMVDAVIAGAGIAGVATAWGLAERLGHTDVVLVDPLPPLSATSNRPEANYRDWWPQRAMAELADRSLELIDELLADGASIPMDRRGYLYVTKDEARAATLRPLVAARNAAHFAGGGVDVLDSTVLQREWPHLTPDVVAGLRVRRAGGLDTVALGRAMLSRAAARGVTVERGSIVGVQTSDSRVVAVNVSTASGMRRISTARFANAAGPFAMPLLTMVGAALRFETVLRQKVVVADRLGLIPRDAPFTITLDPGGELPGGIHVKPDDTYGLDTLKLGWAWDQRSSAPELDPACPPEFADMVLRGAAAWFPGLSAYDRASILAHEGGFYARTPDGEPLIGRVGPEGSFVVGALAGFGAMMAAGIGELAAAWIMGDPATPQMGAFAPDRFEDPAYVADIATGKIPTGEL
jgi:glycine/D-amino acid oxidase-like deaminating enzyme